MLIDLETKRESSTMGWSPFQDAFFSSLKESKNNILLEAVAGSGKTTTIVEGLHRIPTGEHALFLAFNKSIADELGTKVPYGVDASTMHSLGIKTLRANGYTPKINKNKSYHILRKDLLGGSDADQEFYDEWGREIVRFVSAMKGSFITLLDEQEFTELYKHSALLLPTTKFGSHLAYRLYKESCTFDGAENNEIDFDDMLRLPLALPDIKWQTYDWVFIDEVQDLNRIQRSMVDKVSSGRVVAVGDSSQAIYAFRGADYDSLLRMEHKFDMTKLPLSVSYRCPKAVVREAQKFQPAIQAREGTPQGVVSTLTYEEAMEKADNNTHILCRTTAPLVQMALRLGTKGKTMAVLGKDVTWAILNQAKIIDAALGSLSRENVRKYYNGMREELIENPRRLDNLKDKCTIIGYCLPAEGFLTIKDLKGILHQIFNDKPSPESVTLSTVHKAKGLEADTVMIIRPDLMPHPLADSPEALQQEDNIQYVAITRAKKELYYVV